MNHEVPFDIRFRWDSHACGVAAPELDRRLRACVAKEFGEESLFVDVEALVVLPKPKPVVHGPDCLCCGDDDTAPIYGESSL